MGNVLRKILSDSLKTLEQGAFQDFCQLFLPIYNNRYESLERHGTTSGGKTRKGTPDLIKTFSNGSQIAAQCSTDEDYWKSIPDSKPKKDVKKCLDKLQKLEEIVLCSNQAPPTSEANIKSALILWAQSIKGITYTLFSLSNFEEEILNNSQKYISLIERFLPLFYAYLQSRIPEVILKVYSQQKAPLDVISNLVKKLAASLPVNSNLYDSALELSSSLKSRFQRAFLPDRGQIVRTNKLYSSCPNPFGNIINIFGPPKIGKTTWVSQYLTHFDDEMIEPIWFDAPFERYNDEFFSDLTRKVIGYFFGSTNANDFAEGKILPQDLQNLKSVPEIKKSLLLIIDNIDNIPIEYLREFIAIFRTTTKAFLNNSLGIILIGYKDLKSEGLSINHNIASPPWNIEELESLLLLHKLAIKDNLNSYCKLLILQAGGHPLVAISIAKQAPSITELIPLSLVKQEAALFDVDLTEEVKHLLFDKLLPDIDHKNMVLRLSALLFPFSIDLAVSLSESIDPRIVAPAPLLLESLKGHILEGDDSIGYVVSPIFKKVSQQYNSTEFIKSIYKVAGKYLLTPRTKIVDAIDMSNGISYCIVAGNLELAFYWASFLLLKMPSTLSNEQKSFLLDNLFLIETIETPPLEVQPAFALVLIQLAKSYSQVDNYSKGIKLLRQVISLKIEESSKLPNVGELLLITQLNLSIFLALNGDLPSSLKELDKLAEISSPMKYNYLVSDLAASLISKCDIFTIPRAFLVDQIDHLEVSAIENFQSLIDCFLGIGLVIGNSDKSTADIFPILSFPRTPKWRLFLHCANVQALLQKNQPKLALEILAEIESLLSSLSVNSAEVLSRVMILKGDAYFNLGDFNNAAKEYRTFLEMPLKQSLSFNHGWASQRIAQASEDLSEKAHYFGEAYRIYSSLGLKGLASRVKGEISILHFRNGLPGSFVETIEELINEYYLSKTPEYAPAVAIGLALLTKFKAMSKNDDKILSDERFPDIASGIFIRVLNEAKPNPGKCLAYYNIAEAYELVESIDNALRCYSIAFDTDLDDELEIFGRIKSGIALIINYVKNGNLDPLESLLSIFFTKVKFPERFDENSFCRILFYKIETDSKTGKISIKNIMRFLNILETSCANLLIDKNQDFWFSEIYKRKAGIGLFPDDSNYQIDSLLKSWKFAKKSDNFSVLADVGFCLGFYFPSSLSSLKEVAEVHLSIVLGICHDDRPLDRVKAVGINLFHLWKDLDFKVLRESDLPFLRLRNKAKEMERENITDTFSAFSMVLQLLTVFNKIDDPAFSKAAKFCLAALDHN